MNLIIINQIIFNIIINILLDLTTNTSEKIENYLWKEDNKSLNMNEIQESSKKGTF